MVSRKTVSSWENNRTFPDIYTLLKISEIYDISINDLLKSSQDLLDNYESYEILSKKRYRLNRFCYKINVLLMLLNYIDIVNPLKIHIPLLIFITLINNIVWIMTKSDSYVIKTTKMEIVIASTLFFIFEINFSIFTNIIYEGGNSFMSQINVYNLLTTLLRSIVMMISFLILIFGMRGLKK